MLETDYIYKNVFESIQAHAYHQFYNENYCVLYASEINIRI